MKAVTNSCMRASDAWTIEHLVPSKELMRRAGEGIFTGAVWAEPVAIVCGKGNNAGDGFVVASYMKKAGIACTLFLLSDIFSEDGKFYYDEATALGVPVVHISEGTDNPFLNFKSIVDCIFGTGFHGEPEGLYKQAIQHINAARDLNHTFVVSADINSGINGDTGEGSIYVISDLTVAIGMPKIGSCINNGLIARGEIKTVDIGIKIIGEIIDCQSCQ